MVKEEIIASQPSWTMSSRSVRMSICKLGAQMAPVLFAANTDTPVQPYHVSPWQGEAHPELAGKSEATLRGDFFCLPFGFAEPLLGMPSHGNTASREWTTLSEASTAGRHILELQIKNALGSADVRRTFLLRDDEDVAYDRTVIRGLAGTYTMGHHAVLRLPRDEGKLLVSTSRQRFGMTVPAGFASASQGEMQSLATAAEFLRLEEVPAAVAGSEAINCSAFPARRGFTDLLQIAVETEPGQPAWTAAVNTEEGYLWFALRDVRMLPSTIFWIENCGRHTAPWNGRNISLGLEDVCSYFDRGSAVSASPNEFSARGIRTAFAFDAEKETVISYAQGVVNVPREFGHAKSAVFDATGVEFTGGDGAKVRAAVHTGFVFGEALP